MAVDDAPTVASTQTTGAAGSVTCASAGAADDDQSGGESDSPADVLFVRLREQRALARSLKQQGVDAAIIKTADDTANATEQKWLRAKPPPRASQKLRRAEDAYARACSGLASAEREVREHEERATKERVRLAQRRASALDNVARRREHLEAVRREVGGGAPLPLAAAPSGATCDVAGVRSVHVAIDTDIGPELVSLLDLAEEGTELYGRLAGAVARLNDAASALGVSTAVGAAASGPSTYDIGAGEGDDQSCEGDELSSLGDSDVTVPEPEDRLPPPGGASPAAPAPAPPAPSPATPPAPSAGGTAVPATSGHMADSTKRGAPEEDGGSSWTATGHAAHGAGAWRKGDGGGSDEESRPPGKGRRTAATEAPGGDGGGQADSSSDRVARQQAIELQIQELRRQHAQLEHQQQQQQAHAASGADPAALAAAQAQTARDHQRLEATATAVAEERRRLRIAELRSQAGVNGAVLPPQLR